MSLKALVFGGALAAFIFSAPPALKSGIEISLLDASVRPQDDLFSYVNGGWLGRTEIPPDRVSYGTFIELADRADADIKGIIDEIAARPHRRTGSIEQQIVDLYASLMDEARIEELGALPIRSDLDRIEEVKTPRDLAREAGYLTAIGLGGPFPSSVEVDAVDPSRPIVRLTQGGTVLPDRDHYLRLDPESSAIRARYEAYLSRVLTLIGRDDSASLGKAVLAFETRLAEAQWTQVESRDPRRTNNRRQLSRLVTEMPGFDWIAWGKPQGMSGGSEVILSQLSFFKAFAALINASPLETSKAWLAARYVTAQAPFLSRAFDEARFDFFGTLLSGQQLPRTRWKRGVSLVNGYLGDAVGRLYVAKRFPPEAKARAKRLLANVLGAFRESIKQLDWMSGGAKAEAMFKVSRMSVKIGAPESWRDYSRFVVKKDDLIGNIQRGRNLENQQQMARLTSTSSRDDWLMTPQTVNAYYSPARNEIDLPAAVLQPPLFDVEADDAVNYGAIGAIIGHEISHALDERGRYVDGEGAMREWWKPQDEQGFKQRTSALAEQFSAMSPIEGLRVNGELTSRENVGDLGGLEVAFRAYRNSLGGAASSVIDGFTGEQRFFIGWAQAWRSKTREEYLRQSLLWNPYAPAQFRANGPVSNVPGFYEAFKVAPGDRLYRDAERRVRIWSAR